MEATATMHDTVRTPNKLAANALYWGSTGFLFLLMASGGLFDALRDPSAVAVLEKLGYPSYFALILGVAKLLGSVALIAPVPRTVREWAYAGFTFDVSAAVLSLLAVGAPVSGLGIPFFALALVFVSYGCWRRRLRSQA